jgi:hypothetical protein
MPVFRGSFLSGLQRAWKGDCGTEVKNPTLSQSATRVGHPFLFVAEGGHGVYADGFFGGG